MRKVMTMDMESNKGRMSQANPLTVYLRMEVGAIRHEVAKEVKKPRRLNMAVWATVRDNLLTLITTRKV